MTELLHWLIVLIVVIGAGLNVRRKWQGFIFWLVSNGYWCRHNIVIGEYAQAVIFAMFFLLSVYGIWHWRRQGPEIGDRAPVITFCRRILKMKGLKPWGKTKVNWLFKEAKRILEQMKETNG